MALAPGSAPARVSLALALTAADRLTPALAEARRAVDLDPQSADAQAALGIVLRLRKDHDAALAASRRAAEIAPDDPRILSVLADALREAGLFAEAVEMYGQAIDLDHEAIVPQLGAAAALQKGGRGETARRAYGVLLERWDYAMNRTRLGAAALLVATQDFEAALAMYERIEIADNGSLPTVLALYGKAYCLQRLGREPEAEYFLSRIVERLPRDYDGPARGREILFDAYRDLVSLYESRDREGKAESLLRAACSRPLAPTPLARLLAARLQAKGRVDEAGDLLGRAILGADPREDPLDLSESALMLARLRATAGRRRPPPGSEAGRPLRLAAERVDSSPLGVVHYRIARAWALAGERDAALKSLERAGALGYLPLDLLAREPDFETLRREPAFEALLRR